MWKLVGARVDEENVINSYLAKGYEPFGVSVNYNLVTVWLKKEMESLGGKVEIHNKRPKSKSGTGRGTTPKPKG